MYYLIAQNFSGINGFLPGSRAALMTDVVFLALFVLVPAMVWSILVARGRKPGEDARLLLHKRVQVTLGVVLAIAIVAFEIDVRFISDWEERAESSPYFVEGGWGAVWISLVIHLMFAIPTLFLWIYVIAMALRKFPSPPQSNDHSRAHVFWARLAATGMLMTALTGWTFYYLAFVA